MTRADIFHSRIVAGLRIALPLIALALLSMLFLLSRDVDPSRALPYASVDAEDLARDPRITGPRLSGVTDDGTALTVTAATVRIASGDAETLSAEGVTALFEAPDGGVTRVISDTALLDRLTDRMTLAGAVTLSTDSGYRLDSDLLRATLDRTRIESPGPVAGHAPAGDLAAGAMLVTAEPGPGGAPAAHRLLFTGGVRLLYRPDTPEAETDR